MKIKIKWIATSDKNYRWASWSFPGAYAVPQFMEVEWKNKTRQIYSISNIDRVLKSKGDCAIVAVRDASHEGRVDALSKIECKILNEAGFEGVFVAYNKSNDKYILFTYEIVRLIQNATVRQKLSQIVPPGANVTFHQNEPNDICLGITAASFDDDTITKKEIEKVQAGPKVNDKNTAPIFCQYNGSQYSVGALVCQNGSECVCDTDGTWHPTGNQCTTFKPITIRGSGSNPSKLKCVKSIDGQYYGGSIPLVNVCKGYMIVTIIWDGVKRVEHKIIHGDLNNSNSWTYIPVEGTRFDLVAERPWP